MENGSKMRELIREGDVCGICHNHMFDVSRGSYRVSSRKKYRFRFGCSSIFPNMHGEVKSSEMGMDVFNFAFGCSTQGKNQGCVVDVNGAVDREVGTLHGTLAGKAAVTGRGRGVCVGEEFEERRIVRVEGSVEGFHCCLEDYKEEK